MESFLSLIIGLRNISGIVNVVVITLTIAFPIIWMNHNLINIWNMHQKGERDNSGILED